MNSKISRNRRLLLASVAGVCIGLGGASSAMAQTGGADPASGQAEIATVGEVIVTAQHRPESVQSAPMAITALTGETLSVRGIQSIEDLQQGVPGLTFGKNVGAGGAKVALRGIGTENPVPGGDPGVAIHVDGVYVQSPSFLQGDLFDVERVEVLRGPQGTLYGRNATGGSINIITRQPTSDFSASVKLTAGNFNLKELQVAFGGPIVDDKLLGRLTFTREKRDGYERNLAPNPPEARSDSADNWTVRGQLKLLFTPDFTMTLRVHALNDDGLRSPLLILQDYPTTQIEYAAFGALPNPTARDPRTYRSNYPIFSPEREMGGSLEAVWDLPIGRLTSVTGYEHDRYDYQYDIDASDAVDQQQSKFRTKYQTYSEELRLSSRGDGPIEWIVGLYYYHERSGFQFHLTDNSFGILTGLGPLIFNNDPVHLEATSYAAFGQLTWKLTDRLSLTGGLRRSHDEKQGLDGTFAPLFGLTDGAGGPLITTYPRTSWDSTSATASLKYRFSPRIMGYATVATGYKPGGFNFGGFQPPYNPETVTSYELGLKSTLADGRLQLNVASFYYDYKDLQVFQIGALVSQLDNAGQATSKGIEFEAQATPIANLLLNASVSWLDARYDKFLTADQSPLNPHGPGVVYSQAGHFLNRSPPWKVSVGGQYTWDFANGSSLTLRGDYAWTDRQYFRSYNLPSDQQPAYDLTNLRVTWSSPGDRYRLEGWVKNLGDADVINNIVVSSPQLGATHNATLAPPRTFGLTLSIDY